VFGLIAGLDEFARIPFYDALAVAASVLSIAVVVVIPRKRRPLHAVEWLRSYVRLADRALRCGPAQYVAALLQPAKLSPNSRYRFRTSAAPSVQEIERAWTKVHSVASGFSPMPISCPNVIKCGRMIMKVLRIRAK